MRPNTDVVFNAVTASASKNSDPIPASQKLAHQLETDPVLMGLSEEAKKALLAKKMGRRYGSYKP